MNLSAKVGRKTQYTNSVTEGVFRLFFRCFAVCWNCSLLWVWCSQFAVRWNCSLLWAVGFISLFIHYPSLLGSASLPCFGLRASHRLLRRRPPGTAAIPLILFLLLILILFAVVCVLTNHHSLFSSSSCCGLCHRLFLVKTPTRKLLQISIFCTDSCW